jgi:amino-acid N-acetyltransferase
LIEVDRATPEDLPAVASLLADAGLPLDGAREAFASGVIARDATAVVGAAALELFRRSALLRSVVVRPSHRDRGLGRQLVDAAEDLARAEGVREVFLLTETAIDWFPRLGYQPLARDEAPADLATSVEFTTACSSTAVLMRRTMEAD